MGSPDRARDLPPGSAWARAAEEGRWPGAGCVWPGSVAVPNHSQHARPASATCAAIRKVGRGACASCEPDESGDPLDVSSSLATCLVRVLGAGAAGRLRPGAALRLVPSSSLATVATTDHASDGGARARGARRLAPGGSSRVRTVDLPGHAHDASLWEHRARSGGDGSRMAQSFQGSELSRLVGPPRGCL